MGRSCMYPGRRYNRLAGNDKFDIEYVSSKSRCRLLGTLRESTIESMIQSQAAQFLPKADSTTDETRRRIPEPLLEGPEKSVPGIRT